MYKIKKNMHFCHNISEKTVRLVNFFIKYTYLFYNTQSIHFNIFYYRGII